MDAPLRLIHISDMHLFGDAKRTLLGVNTQQSFQAVVDLIKTEEKNIGSILITGDLSQDGTRESYVHVADVLKCFKVPIYCVAGNHDNAKNMWEVYPRDNVSNVRHIVVKSWQLILLDSQEQGAVEGHLPPSELNFLQECIKAYPTLHTALLFHHQPINVGSRWLDKLGINNADEFWSLISKFSNVKTIFFGHVHQEFEQEKANIKCYAAPSTCFQFKRKQNHFGIEKLPPGYRWVDLYADGRIETGIKRINDYIGIFEEHATGY